MVKIRKETEDHTMLIVGAELHPVVVTNLLADTETPSLQVLQSPLFLGNENILGYPTLIQS